MKFYGNYKNFQKQNYPVLSVSKIEDFLSVQETFTSVLHKHAPTKQKILRNNNNPYLRVKGSNYVQVKIDEHL